MELFSLVVLVCLTTAPVEQAKSPTELVEAGQCHAVRNEVQSFRNANHCLQEADHMIVDKGVWLRYTLRGFYKTETGERKVELEKAQQVFEANSWLYEKIEGLKASGDLVSDHSMYTEGYFDFVQACSPLSAGGVDA